MAALDPQFRILRSYKCLPEENLNHVTSLPHRGGANALVFTDHHGWYVSVYQCAGDTSIGSKGLT